jgi:hypothetical protein
VTASPTSKDRLSAPLDLTGPENDGLHDHALARFGERGVELATLWVLEINDRARVFYEALGWEDTDRRSELQFAAQTEPSRQYTRQVALSRRARSPKGSGPGVR